MGADAQALFITKQALDLCTCVPGFMAPETAWNCNCTEPTRPQSSATDVWSLGAVLYFLVTKKPSMENFSVADCLHATRVRA